MIGILLVGCESKQMKHAKDFLSLEDWVNAGEKLELEIKNNPKNLKAYQLLLVAKRNLYFPEYKDGKFLDPYEAKLDDFHIAI